MSALAAERNTVQAAVVQRSPLSWPVKGSTKIYKGSLVVLNAGYAAPGSTATALIAVGRAKKTVDNTSGADGALTVEVEEGEFWWANAGGDAVVAADRGAVCYITDDQTVNHTSTGKSVAGRVIAIDSTLGVLVRTALNGMT